MVLIKKTEITSQEAELDIVEERELFINGSIDFMLQMKGIMYITNDYYLTELSININI